MLPAFTHLIYTPAELSKRAQNLRIELFSEESSLWVIGFVVGRIYTSATCQAAYQTTTYLGTLYYSICGISKQLPKSRESLENLIIYTP